MAEQRIESLSELGLDMFDPQVIARPHAFYAQLREKAPIVWSEQTQSWLLTRYEDVRRVLRDNELFSSRSLGEGRILQGRDDVVIETVEPPGTLNMLGADRPDHTRLRKLVSLDFTPKKMERMQPRIEEICRATLAGAAEEETFDVVKGIAEPLPVSIIADFLGIPAELHVQFKRWSDAATTPIAPTTTDEQLAARNQQIVEFRDYLKAQIDARHDHPTDDFIGRVVAAHDDEDRLTDDEVLGSVNLLLLAGNETTTNLISNAVLALCQFPERQAELRENPDLMDAAVEEFLRYDGSVQFTSRTLTGPAEFQGVQLQAGQRVVPIIASANRDERVFERPDELDFHREGGKHMGFGDWIHICVGQYLARMETRAALHAILEAFDRFELAIDPNEIPYRPNFTLRGPSRLPIRRAA